MSEEPRSSIIGAEDELAELDSVREVLGGELSEAAANAADEVGSVAKALGG